MLLGALVQATFPIVAFRIHSRSCIALASLNRDVMTDVRLAGCRDARYFLLAVGVVGEFLQGAISTFILPLPTALVVYIRLCKSTALMQHAAKKRRVVSSPCST